MIDDGESIGEAVGLSGLLGSGRTESCRAIFALDPPDEGEIRFHGRRVRLRDPRSAIALGMALAPEERREQGIIGELSVRENIVLALQARRGWWRRIGVKRETALAAKAVEELKITTAGLETAIQNLSGGNQQKIVLAREMEHDPDVLIVGQPTRGVDIGAIEFIHNQIIKMRDAGKAILLVSVELDEVRADITRWIELEQTALDQLFD